MLVVTKLLKIVIYHKDLLPKVFTWQVIYYISPSKMPMDTKLGKVLTLSERLPPYDPLITWTIWNHLTNQKNYISIWRGLKLKWLSRHWLFANFEIVFYFAANLSSCFNDGGAAFYYERFYTFQWVLTQRNCPLKWFWDNPLNKWLSVSLLISMQWNPNFPTLTIQYDHCPWLKTFLQKTWVITNRSTIHHDPPRPTTTKKIPTTNLHHPKQTHYYPKNTQNHLSPPKKYQLPLTTTQNMLTTIQRHTKSTHHHPSPLTIKSHHLPKPTTPQNISATTHHHHPSPKKKPPLPTTTPNIYSITHNIPTTTHHHPIYNHHHPN